jgi:hypothetical protein
MLLFQLLLHHQVILCSEQIVFVLMDGEAEEHAISHREFVLRWRKNFPLSNGLECLC